MKTKRGVIEVQFNWIFVLIAGAIILLLFVIIVQRQSDVSEEKASIDIKTKFKTILVSAKQSTNTLFSLQMPKTEITYDCNGYSVKGTNPIVLGESFSPSVLKSVTRTLYLWSLDWSVPYKTANFQYIVSPDVRYIVDDSGDNATELYNLLPENITKEFVNLNQINIEEDLEDRNNYRVKFIFVDNEPDGISLPGFLKNMKNEDVTAIKIDIGDCEAQPNSIFDGCGNVSFYEKDDANFDKKGKYPYLKKESLLGAIFVDNNDTYECIMKRAMKKLEITTKVYYNRTSFLYEYFQDIERSNYCKERFEYFLGLKRLNSTITNSTEFLFKNVKDIYNEVYTRDINSLKSLNKELQRGSCPLIY